MAPNSFQNDSDLKKIQGRYSPVSIFLITIIGIAFAEVVAMVFIYSYRHLPYLIQTVMDTVVMTIIIYPILYFLSFRPLLQHIEERWRAEKKVQEMALFPALNPDAVLQVDAAGKIVKCNPAAEQMGFSVDAQLFDLVPDLRDLNLSDCIASGITLQVYETRMAERILQWKIRGATELGFAFLYSQDITERKRGEEAIKLLSSIVEQTADTVVVTNRDGVVEYVNPAVEKATGYQKEDILGNTPRVLKSGLHDGQFYGELWKTILDGNAFHGEITNRKKNGDLFHEAKTITPLRNTNGNITHFVATGKDITERKEAEEKLRRAYDDLEQRVQERTEELVATNAALLEEISERKRAEEQLQYQGTLLSNVNDAIIASDAQFHLTAWNAAAESLYGWKSEEVLGSIGLDIIHTEWVEKDSSMMRRVIAETGRWRGEATQIRKDGTRFPVEVSSIVLYDERGQVTGYVSVNRDITERKKAERELQQLNRTFQALSASNQAMMRAQDEAELLNEVCKIVVDVCGHAMVWIGYAEENEEKTVRPVASAGFEEGYLETLHITWADTERGRGPTGTAIRTGTPCGCRNMLTDPQFAPWREHAIQRGYASSIVLPLLMPEKTLGALTIYAREPDAFSSDEENLLFELASDLAHGVEMIRLRDAHERATIALRESEERFRLALVHAPVMVAVQDRDLRYTWAYNQRNRPLDEVVGKTDFDLFPLEAEHLTDIKHRVIETGENASEQFWANNDNQRLFLDLFIEPLRNASGEIDGVGLAAVDLTAIKLAEEALRQSEEQFYKIFHSSPVGVNLFRLSNAHSVDVNDAFLELTEYSREECIGHSSLELNLFPNPEERAAWMKGLREHGSVRNIDTQIRKKSGQIANILFSIVQVEIGSEAMGLVMAIDITERRRAEEALRRAHDELEQRVRERTKELASANRELSEEIAERREIERQLRIETTALEAAADGVIITDTSGKILWANPAFLNMSGYCMQEVIGATPQIISSGKQDKAYYQDLWGTIMSGNTWRGETINRRKDGTLYVEEQTITPVRHENGELTHFIAIKQDVTERKQAEDAVRASEEKFRTLVEWTYDWEIWLDPGGNIIYNSPSCERITGYEPAEFIAIPELMAQIVHPEDRAMYDEHLKMLHDGSAGMEKVEYRVIARNGRERWIEHVCRPLFGIDNRYLGRRISNRDITEQKQIEENIRESNRKEKLLTQTIHTMQLDIARDLHDTIGQNIGFLRMKLDHMVEKDLAAKGVDLKSEFNQMSQVANESYDLVRGTLAILQSQGSDDLLQLFKRYASQIVERSAVKIEFNNQGKAEFVTIQQTRQLFYIFREALSNIEKHSHATQAWVDMTWGASVVELSIRDNGKGFDPTQDGIGHYGLKFMRERTEMMKGSYQLITKPGAGTQIVIGVPLHGNGSENQL